MSRYKDLRFGAIQILKNAGVENPAMDARLLLQYASGKNAAELIMADNDIASDEIANIFHEVLGRRAAREPIAYILGYKDFWNFRFKVDENVLIPRADTETLVRVALDLCPDAQNMLDIGVGSGAILLSLLSEIKTARGVGVDISARALQVASANAKTFGLDDRCEFLLSDYLNNVKGKFDLIIANPPYINADEMQKLAPEIELYEPEQALFGGVDGLDAYRKIIDGVKNIARPNAVLVFEIGHMQKQKVKNLLSHQFFANISCTKDLAGKDRVISAKICA